MRHQDKLRLWQPASHTIIALEQLYALRDRLLKSKQTLEVPLQEQKNFMATTHYALMEKYALPAIQSIEKQVAEVEAQIKQIIEEDNDFKTLIQLLDSIPGIGENIATPIIVKTQAFTRFTDPKKFACHAGTAPFSYTSGTSVRAKTKVSVYADKELKKLLHLAAICIVRGKTLLAKYYQRKIAKKRQNACY
ncbi:transposase [Thermoflexibacter ruber]|uniref:Transposase IS116/IS110/IS902 family protein n=1 Tax=Thermoflexibacter ruber TaxID=1003 RepID=A0A1I2I426_9BACT|nr:transposase [Thermoflexibacter ruber]SFF35666.1 Transposase IS116/IS110/IS902 family protein [Thermoflexibacter ruber]